MVAGTAGLTSRVCMENVTKCFKIIRKEIWSLSITPADVMDVSVCACVCVCVCVGACACDIYTYIYHLFHTHSLSHSQLTKARIAPNRLTFVTPTPVEREPATQHTVDITTPASALRGDAGTTANFTKTPAIVSPVRMTVHV